MGPLGEPFLSALCCLSLTLTPIACLGSGYKPHGEVLRIRMLEDIGFLATAPWRTCIGEKVTEEKVPSSSEQKVKSLWKPQEAGLVAKPREMWDGCL